YQLAPPVAIAGLLMTCSLRQQYRRAIARLSEEPDRAVALPTHRLTSGNISLLHELLGAAIAEAQDPVIKPTQPLPLLTSFVSPKTSQSMEATHASEKDSKRFENGQEITSDIRLDVSAPPQQHLRILPSPRQSA